MLIEDTRLNRVIVHVGPHKTGTTTLQHHFSTAPLRNCIYATTPGGSDQHESIAWSLSKDGASRAAQVGIDLPEAETLLKEEIYRAAAGGAALLLSSEEFSRLTRSEIAGFGRVCSDAEVTSIVCVRDTLSVLMGLRSERLAYGGSWGTAADFAGALSESAMQVARVADRWSTIGKVVLVKYSARTLVDDVFDLLGEQAPKGAPVKANTRSREVHLRLIQVWLAEMAKYPNLLPPERHASFFARNIALPMVVWGEEAGLLSMVELPKFVPDAGVVRWCQHLDEGRQRWLDRLVKTSDGRVTWFAATRSQPTVSEAPTIPETRLASDLGWPKTQI